MDDRIGRLVANVGVDRTAAVMAVGIIVQLSREGRAESALVEAARAAASAASILHSRLGFRRRTACAKASQWQAAPWNLR